MPLPQYYTQGGTHSYAMWSGTIGGDVAITSGRGRVNLVVTHQSMLSGVQVTLYDSAIAVSGGPRATSGHIPLGGVGGLATGASGIYNVTGGAVTSLQTRFNSGLCLSSASGQPGVTVFYTYESSTQGQGT